jgi:hypothetical protein
MATLSTLIAAVRSRIDRVGSAFISDSEITGWLNEGLAELWDVITQANQDYTLESDTVSIVSGTNTYDLSSFDPEILRIRGVTLAIGTLRYTLSPCSIRERDHDPSSVYPYVYLPDYYGGGSAPHNSPYRYRLEGLNLVITPEPQESGTATVYYTPKVTLLSSPSDTTDSALEAHWLKHAIYHACIEAREKEEEDTTSLQRRRIEMEQRIKKAVKRRTTDPKRIIDVNAGGWGYGR